MAYTNCIILAPLLYIPSDFFPFVETVVSAIKDTDIGE